MSFIQDVKGVTISQRPQKKKTILKLGLFLLIVVVVCCCLMLYTITVNNYNNNNYPLVVEVPEVDTVSPTVPHY